MNVFTGTYGLDRYPNLKRAILPLMDADTQSALHEKSAFIAGRKGRLNNFRRQQKLERSGRSTTNSGGAGGKNGTGPNPTAKQAAPKKRVRSASSSAYRDTTARPTGRGGGADNQSDVPEKRARASNAKSLQEGQS